MNYDPGLPVDQQTIDDTDPKWQQAVDSLVEQIIDDCDVTVTIDHHLNNPIEVFATGGLKDKLLCQPEIELAVRDHLKDNPEIVVDYLTDEEDKL